MDMIRHTCDLCGLPIPDKAFNFYSNEQTHRFCCRGCKQVFSMLMEASPSADPATFRQSALFRKCRDMGIIPRSDAELFLSSQAPAPKRSIRIDPEGPGLSKEGAKKIGNSPLSLVLKINDMWCPACAWIIEEALKKSKGILTAACSFSTDRVRCDYDPVRASPAQIVAFIKELGYQATTIDSDAGKGKNKDFIRLTVSVFLTLNVMMLSFSLYTGFFIDLSPDTIYKLSWPIFIMATIVLFYGGHKIYSKALTGLFSATFGMEALITAGAFSAYIYSSINLISGNIHLYYDTASMLITLVLLGKRLEKRAKDRILDDLESFFSLQPKKVKICSPLYPQGRYAHTEQLKSGDVFQITENEVVPADGPVLEGSGSLDESSLTGEALPVPVKAGDRIRAGSRVIGGTLRVKADEVGENSTLGQLIQIMAQAINEKTPLEGRTDRILQWFVPFILTLAMVIGLVGLIVGLSVESAMIRAVAVVVISCPCALGIAIPLARVAGITVAGKNGILVRTFSCFERASHVNAIVFDKTGTITQGKWKLLDILTVQPFTADEVLALAASLENRSEHYIAREIARQAEKRKLTPVEMDHIEIFENGISGYLGNEKIKIGSKSFLAAELETSDIGRLAQTAPADAVPSSVFLSRDGRICGVFIFGDQIKTGAAELIKKLDAAGYSNLLVSGDGHKTTKAVGKKNWNPQLLWGHTASGKSAAHRPASKKGPGSRNGRRRYQ
jgi:heavy metal translocating P-type ATPase